MSKQNTRLDLNRHLREGAGDGKIQAINFLLQQGADVNAVNRRGYSALDCAIAYKNLCEIASEEITPHQLANNVIFTLLKAGAKVKPAYGNIIAELIGVPCPPGVPPEKSFVFSLYFDAQYDKTGQLSYYLFKNGMKRKPLKTFSLSDSSISSWEESHSPSYSSENTLSKSYDSSEEGISL